MKRAETVPCTKFTWYLPTIVQVAEIAGYKSADTDSEKQLMLEMWVNSNGK